MEIQIIPTEQLNLTKYNPRKDLKPGDEEYEKLKRSIEQFGYVEPIIWNRTTSNVVGGHQRLKVLLGMGTDYGVFLLEHRGDPSAWLAVCVGAASTWLSFGLLALSTTPALRAFGLTLLVGIGLVWLISPLLRSPALGPPLQSPSLAPDP